jgi:hypothetical protein
VGWSARACMLELLLNPFVDVGTPVSDMSTDPESGWPLSSVPPLVQGPDRHAQVLGELLDGHELFVGCHGLTFVLDPFDGLSTLCQQPFRKPFRRTSHPWSGAFPA